MDEVAAIVQAIEMSAKPPPVQPEKKTLLGTVEKFFEQAFRHKTISFIAGFTILASMIVMGIYLQSRSMGALDKASSSIQQSGTEISAAAVTIKDSGEKVAALGGKLDGLKKETSDDPKKELANMGLAWHEQAFFSSLGDPRIAGLFIQGGMKLSKNYVVMMLANMTMQPEALKKLLPSGGVEFYGECPEHKFLVAWLPPIHRDVQKFNVFKALCNPNGELTKKLKGEYDALMKPLDELERRAEKFKSEIADTEKALRKQEKIADVPNLDQWIKRNVDAWGVEQEKSQKLALKMQQLKDSLSDVESKKRDLRPSADEATEVKKSLDLLARS
jgi:uncharacterized protein YeeX (DUF496 family)